LVFNSIEFVVFLVSVFTLYWFFCFSKLGLQNILILAASCVFYGWWDVRFLSLIFISIIADFFIAKQIHRTSGSKGKKIWLGTSLFINLGMLGFFKYWNFFVDSWISAWSGVGVTMNSWSLSIILPVGISFYTFQTLSYTIDVYRGHMKPSENFLQFASYVSFFPQLVAGPIERAARFLPQFEKVRKFEYGMAADGVRQILWGLFKKTVIADNCAHFVNLIYQDSSSMPASYLAVGTLLFAFQIYGDFSGYSDIAIGVAKLFGFNLMTNFKTPYFSRSIPEFWKKWHISLTSWFKDYLYIPLGGSRGSRSKTIRNILIIFLVSGLWHGANWTFIIWGLLHFLYFIPSVFFGKTENNRDPQRAWTPLFEPIKMLITFGLTCLAWVYFRSGSVGEANEILIRIVTLDSTGPIPGFNPVSLSLTASLLFFLVMEWTGKSKPIPLKTASPWINRVLYFICVFSILILGYKKPVAFIYFQF